MAVFSIRFKQKLLNNFNHYLQKRYHKNYITVTSFRVKLVLLFVEINENW